MGRIENPAETEADGLFFCLFPFCFARWGLFWFHFLMEAQSPMTGQKEEAEELIVERRINCCNEFQLECDSDPQSNVQKNKSSRY